MMFKPRVEGWIGASQTKMGRRRGSVFMQWPDGYRKQSTCEVLRVVQNGWREEENGEIKPRKGPDFASLYRSGERVWALFKEEWEGVEALSQKKERELKKKKGVGGSCGVQAEAQYDQISIQTWTVSATGSWRSLSLHFLSTCCLFPLKTLEKSMKWALFVPRTCHSITFEEIRLFLVNPLFLNYGLDFQ